MAKALANRLREAIGFVIDDNQSAFIAGRNIGDNIMVGFECNHWLRARKRGRVGYATLKLDMSKAYDRIEWVYVKRMMKAMGFGPKLVGRVLDCVSTTKFLVLVNGQPSEPFTASRGLRQGDPLSPYLFILCAQGFSSLIPQQVQNEAIHGIRISRRSPEVSHLFFADDSLVFFQADVNECRALHHCISIYEKASGQVVNFEKSTISFSPNTSPYHIGQIKEMLGVRVAEGLDLYLGLPTFTLRSKNL